MTGASAAGEQRVSQRRFVTVVYSDLSHSTRISATMEAEDFVALLDRIRTIFVRTVERHRGVVVKTHGDGVICLFGYPEIAEDDATRAMLFALAVHREVSGMAFRTGGPRVPLGLHTGIHAGIGLLDFDPASGRMDIFGSAMNVAARLSDAAVDDEILVSQETATSDRGHVSLSSPRALKLQGWPALLPVVAVRRAMPQPFVAQPLPSAGLTGRADELALLADRFRRAGAGEANCVALVAEGGVGKSRLAEHFLRLDALSDVQVLRASCDSIEKAEPLTPMLRMLRQHLHDVGATDDASIGERIDRWLPVLPGDRFDRRAAALQLLSTARHADAASGPPSSARSAELVVELLGAIVVQQSTVVFIDDFDRADDATQRVVDAVRRIAGRRLFVLLTARRFEPGRAEIGDVEIVRLDPLGDTASDRVIRRLAPQADPFVTDLIRRQAGGNPLFIEEMCHALGRAEATRGMTPAARLHALIQVRVSRLPKELAAVVRTAAVIGNAVSTSLLERLARVTIDAEMERSLAHHDFMFRSGPDMLRFKHGIVRDVVYDGIDLRQRRYLHLRCAALLKRHDASATAVEPVELLAHHYSASGQAFRGSRYSERAGDKALKMGALDFAQTHYCTALDAIDDPESSPQSALRWASIAQRLGATAVYDPSHDKLDYLGRAVEIARKAGDPVHEVRARYWMGYVQYALGDAIDAIPVLRSALELAQRGGEPMMVTELTSSLGQAHASLSQYAVAGPLLDRAITAKRAVLKSGQAESALAYALACRGAVLGDQGDFGGAHGHFDEALGLVRGSAHHVEGSVCALRTAVLLWHGRWAEARETAGRAEAVASRVKSLYVYAQAVALGAYADWRLHGDPRALVTMRNATGWQQSRQRGLFVSLNHGWLAEAASEAGDAKTARLQASHAFDRWRRGDRLGAAGACRALARLALVDGMPRASRRYLALGTRLAEARGSSHDVATTKLCAAELGIAFGRDTDDLRRTFSGLGMQWHAERLERLRERRPEPAIRSEVTLERNES